MIRFEFLKAKNGDATLITLEEETKKTYILIDGGPAGAYNGQSRKKKYEDGHLKTRLNEIFYNGDKIDLLILTHVDNDHICGILEWMGDLSFSPDNIDKIWFNSGQLIQEHFKKKPIENYDLFIYPDKGIDTGIKEGVSFEKFILEHKLWERKLIRAIDEIEYFNIKFIILSPNLLDLGRLLEKWKEESPESIIDTAGNSEDYQMTIRKHLEEDKFVQDRSKHNASSISFILTYQEFNFLLLGDSHPRTIIKSLYKLGYSKENRLSLNLMKVSHHGSKANTNMELLNLIDCERFVISTNGDSYNHPHKKCLARIIQSNPQAKIFFNYDYLIDDIFSAQDYVDYPQLSYNLLKSNVLHEWT